LTRNGVDREEVALISSLHEYAGASLRVGDLLGTKNIFTLARKQVKRGLTGVTNIYSQHKPLLAEILEQVSKNKLKDSVYPYLVGNPTKDRPQDVIVFIMGGTTYEEACTISEFNTKPENQGMRVILGGTTIHNSKSFLKEVARLHALNSSSSLR